jgi:hypothetical protein
MSGGEIFDTTHFKRDRVGIDPESPADVFEAWVRTDYRWNGWAVPLFPESQLERLIDWITRLEGGYFITRVGDTVYMIDNEAQEEITRDTDPEHLWPFIVEPILLNGERCYDIGGYSWVWSEIDDDYLASITPTA